MLKKLIWKWRYARYMNQQTKCGWSFAWYNAGVAVDEQDWKDYEPDHLAYEEISCWDTE